VLGKGSAFGSESAPAPGFARAVSLDEAVDVWLDDGTGAGCGVGAVECDAHPAAASDSASARIRMRAVVLRDG